MLEPGFFEKPMVIECAGQALVGILHSAAMVNRRGVVIVVGGPQYRVGSHRQFVLLARYLARRGFSVLRFDYRGMGDSGGERRTFENIGEDITSAIEAFVHAQPELREIVIWGLCDAASAALFYAHLDERVKGLVLLNPWVHTEQSEAKVYLKRYYRQRLLSADLWRKVAKGDFDFQQSLSSLTAFASKALLSSARKQNPIASKAGWHIVEKLPLPERMRVGLERFSGRVLLILSGRDLTADQFRDLVSRDADWQQVLSHPRISRRELPEADHTFSTCEWRDQVACWTLEWLKSW